MRFNTTVTNISPLLLFLPTTSWREEPIASDLQSWTNTTTYHTCNATLAKPSVSFSWNGTAIWIYGDRQPQSSPFRVTLDGETQLQNATGNQEGLIFSAVNLVPATHQIIVTNIGDQDDLSPPTLNFNYLIVESKSYDDNTTNVMIPGSDDQFQYYPEVSGSWNNGSENARTTSCASSGFQLNFTGLSISVYGAVAGSQGGYSASIDGGAWQRYTPNTQGNVTSQLLYFWSGVQVNNHTLIIQNDPYGDSTGSCLSSKAQLTIDHASLYFSPTSPPGSSPAPNNGMSPVSATKRKAVIISVCTGAFAVFLIGWAIKKWYLKRRKDLKDARHTQAPRPFPKEEPYNPHGAPATEVVRIAVISRLSEDVVFDISAENNIPDEPHTDVNQGVHPLKEKTSVGSTLTSLTSSSDSGRHLSHRPLHVGSTLTTTNTTTTSLYSNERRSRPLPSRPRASPIPHRPLMMAPPPYYNISL